MFFRAHLNPTPAKRVIYLCSTVVLGILLSILAHVGIESLYLNWAQDKGIGIVWHSAFGLTSAACALHPIIQWGLVALGAVGGYMLGRFWWRMVYIERWWSKDDIRRQPK